MRKAALIPVFLLLPTTSFSQARQEVTVTITQPAPNAAVAHRQDVSGTTSDPRARIWVVIHPRATGGYWVQTPATVDSDGSWSVCGYFGNAGPGDKGKSYEIRAFANSRVPLRPGERNDWPAAEAQSRVIRVERAGYEPSRVSCGPG
jgi:hypothetical protein